MASSDTAGNRGPSAVKTGRFAVIEQFLADGMDHMFGNPGTVEQGFLDALREYPDMKYVLTLQESVAVLIADGYARATQRPTLVQLHSSPGIGNGVGALYQAKRGHSPLVVIGGDAGVKYVNMDAQMAGDLVGMMAPVTKWATVVYDPGSLLRVIRRAIKIAATPPMGPVYVCLPQDVLDAPSEEPVYPTNIPSTRVAPDEAAVREMALLLASASHPMIFVGDGVAFSGGQNELAAVAELLGAEVWDADTGEVNIAWDHPAYQGMTGHMFGSSSLPIISKGDVNLICGTYIAPEVFPETGSVFAPKSKAIHIDLNAYEIGKNHPFDIGVVADPGLTLDRLAGALREIQTAGQRSAAHTRLEALAKAKREKQEAAKRADAEQRDSVPMRMARFAEALAARLPENAIIFDEALTSSPAITRYVQPRRAGDYFLTRGGSLGVGIPGAIGAKMARPERTVVGFSGDGGSMYTIQALWTAARHKVNAKFVICNNGCYKLLQANIDQYWRERGIESHQHPLPFDLSYPPLGFCEIAKGMSVAAVRVERPSEIEPAIDQMLSHPGPFLIDLVLEGETHPGLVGLACGQ